MSDGTDSSAAVVDIPAVDASVPVATVPEVVEETPVAHTPNVPDAPEPEETPEEPDPIPPPVPSPIDAADSQPAVSPPESRGGQTSLTSPATQSGQMAQPQPAIKQYLTAALEKIRFNKRAKLDKIVALAQKKGRIKNDDVQLLVRVSHVTAARYLRELVQTGRLNQKGPHKQPWYEPVAVSNGAI